MIQKERFDYELFIFFEFKISKHTNRLVICCRSKGKINNYAGILKMLDPYQRVNNTTKPHIAFCLGGWLVFYNDKILRTPEEFKNLTDTIIFVRKLNHEKSN